MADIKQTDLEAMSESCRDLLKRRGLPVGSISDWSFRNELRAHVQSTREAHEVGWRAARAFYKRHPEYLRG